MLYTSIKNYPTRNHNRNVALKMMILFSFIFLTFCKFDPYADNGGTLVGKRK